MFRNLNKPNHIVPEHTSYLVYGVRRVTVNIENIPLLTLFAVLKLNHWFKAGSM